MRGRDSKQQDYMYKTVVNKLASDHSADHQRGVAWGPSASLISAKAPHTTLRQGGAERLAQACGLPLLLSVSGTIRRRWTDSWGEDIVRNQRHFCYGACKVNSQGHVRSQLHSYWNVGNSYQQSNVLSSLNRRWKDVARAGNTGAGRTRRIVCACKPTSQASCCSSVD